MMIDLKYLTDNYSGKKVFITGHTGFKGSWLAFILNKVGADVMGYALPPSEALNHFDLLHLRDKIQHVEGNVCDRSRLTAVLNEFQPEFVFHLAAQALVRPSYEDPFNTFNTNVMGAINLLDAVKSCSSVRSLVFITSDKCYENVEWIWGYRENDPLGGKDPYSASKAAAEIAFSSYASSYFSSRTSLGAASVRAGNVIGGGDWAVDRIVPDCIRAIDAGQAVRLRNPSATRPWQHVLEPLSGYLLLGANLFQNPSHWNGAWNFGPSSTEVWTVGEVAQAIVHHLGRGAIEVQNSSPQMHEARLLQLNCDKAHQLLGWYPRWGGGQTLKATALWYRDFMNGNAAEKITWAQVQEYFGASND